MTEPFLICCIHLSKIFIIASICIMVIANFFVLWGSFSLLNPINVPKIVNDRQTECCCIFKTCWHLGMTFGFHFLVLELFSLSALHWIVVKYQTLIKQMFSFIINSSSQFVNALGNNISTYAIYIRESVKRYVYIKKWENLIRAKSRSLDF